MSAGCAPEFGGGFPVISGSGVVSRVGIPGAPGEVAGRVGRDAVAEAGSPCLVAAGVEIFDGSEEGERFHAVVEGPHGGGAGVDDVFAASFADDARVEEHVCPGADAALRGDVCADFVQGRGGSGGWVELALAYGVIAIDDDGVEAVEGRPVVFGGNHGEEAGEVHRAVAFGERFFGQVDSQAGAKDGVVGGEDDEGAFGPVAVVVECVAENVVLGGDCGRRGARGAVRKTIRPDGCALEAISGVRVLGAGLLGIAVLVHGSTMSGTPPWHPLKKKSVDISSVERRKSTDLFVLFGFSGTAPRHFRHIRSRTPRCTVGW